MAFWRPKMMWMEMAQQYEEVMLGQRISWAKNAIVNAMAMTGK
jgi:hypothetical protein